jgi:hypothetical protein
VITINADKDKDGKEYIQAIDISLEVNGEMYLSMFLRYSCEVYVFKIKDKKIEDYCFKQKIATEWINDVVYSDGNVFACFENETIGRLYPNPDIDEEYEMDENVYEDEDEVE